MRHLSVVTPVEVALLPTRVIRAALVRLLVTLARGTTGLAPGNCGARPGAVPMTVVARRAEEEDLAAPAAGQESKRLDVRVRLIV